MKILIDMNLSPDWVNVLNAAGIEAIHWSTVGDPRAPDREIFAWSRENSYVVFTNDLDFGAILAATQAEAPSVIQIRGQDVLPEQMSYLVINALRKYEPLLIDGALVTVNFNRSKVRILPITLELY
jgi:predicted nuclease of predicted toxin-antitoxin system